MLTPCKRWTRRSEAPPSGREMREGGRMHLVPTGRALRGLTLTTGALLGALACGTTQGPSSGTAQNAPGVTDKEVLIGTTTPLSGAASAYASISKGSTAY